MDKRRPKYSQLNGGVLVRVEDDGDGGSVKVWFWPDTPVELWLYEGWRRIDIRGLEHLPRAEDINRAVKVFLDLKDQYLDEAGRPPGPGPKPATRPWDDRLAPWRASGYDAGVLAQLRQEYLNETFGTDLHDNARETFNRMAHKRKTKWAD